MKKQARYSRKQKGNVVSIIPIFFRYISYVVVLERLRTYYAYPPSASSPPSPTSPSANARPAPLSQRLRLLQAELSSLEAEISDPLNPLLANDKEEDAVDPGELIRGLVDVRGRLEKIRKGKEGRGRLVGAVLGDEPAKTETEEPPREEPKKEQVDSSGKSELQNIVEMDRRVGELEKLVGSSSAILDEVWLTLITISI